MKSHWTIAIYGSVAAINALMIWASPNASRFMFACWVAIVTLCLFRILTEIMDWKT